MSIVCAEMPITGLQKLMGAVSPFFVGNALQVFVDQVILKSAVRAGLGSKHAASYGLIIMKGEEDEVSSWSQLTLALCHS